MSHNYLIRADEILTLQQFIARCGKSSRWVSQHLLSPTDPHSHKPMLDAAGDLQYGIPVREIGDQVYLPGAAVVDWFNSTAQPKARKRLENKLDREREAAEASNPDKDDDEHETSF